MSFVAIPLYRFAVNGFNRLLLLRLLSSRRPGMRMRAAACIAARNPLYASHQENISS